MVSRRPRKSLDPVRARDRQAVRAAAVALLARRDFASTELTGRLLSQGYEPELVANTIGELRQGRILDDARFAEHYVAHHAERGQGSARIATQLRALGLADGLVDAAVQSGPDWRALAREVLIRKFGLAPPRTRAEQARQARFLQYRGFSSDHIRSALGPDFDPDA